MIWGHLAYRVGSRPVYVVRPCFKINEMKWRSDYRYIIQSACCPVAAKLQINLFLLVLVIWGAPLLQWKDPHSSWNLFSWLWISEFPGQWFFFFKEVVWDRILLCSPPASHFWCHWPLVCFLTVSIHTVTWVVICLLVQHKRSHRRCWENKAPMQYSARRNWAWEQCQSLWEALGGVFTWIYICIFNKAV